jgi:hypothetical protein
MRTARDHADDNASAVARNPVTLLRANEQGWNTARSLVEVCTYDALSCIKMYGNSGSLGDGSM